MFLVAEPTVYATVPVTLPNRTVVPVKITDQDDLWEIAEDFLQAHQIGTAAQFFSGDLQSLTKGFQYHLWQERIRQKRVAVLIASRNRPDLVDATVTALKAEGHAGLHIVVAECGTSEELVSPHASVKYLDPENQRGKTYCHGQALEYAQRQGSFDYFLVMMNDLVWDSDIQKLVTPLVALMESNPHLGLVSPTNFGEGKEFPGALNRSTPTAWRPAAAVDYLCMIIRNAALKQTGFLDSVYRYSQGAEHELAFHMWTQGWTVAYTDQVRVRHLGGSTFGVNGTATISRTSYLETAMRFARQHLTNKYGDRWDLTFWRVASSRANIEFNTFTWWRKALDAVISRLDAGTHVIKG